MRTNRAQILAGFIFSILVIACNSKNGSSDAFGNFEADDQLIASEIAGKLLSCNFEEGITLAKGAEIALVDTIPVQLQLAQLESQLLTIEAKKQNVRAQLSVTEQQKKNLEVDHARIVNMLKDGAATKKQEDDLTGSLALTDKQMGSIRSQELILVSETEVVKTQLAQLQDKLNRCRIVSPINGLVLEKYKRSGELVAAGQSLCRIADVSTLNLRVYVSGDQLPHLQTGQKVKVLIDDTKTTNKSLEGTVSWISSEAEFTPKIIQTKAERVKLVYAVKVRVVNDGSLKIGMPGEIRFID
jgi:HlyD family secretion protein